MASRLIRLAVFAGALTLAAPLSACSQVATDGLNWRPEPYPDFAVMPRLTGEGADEVNRLLEGLDEVAKHNRAECLAEEGVNGPEWMRTIWAPFTGPRFVSITVNESYYCGGFHPSVDVRPMTFDRRTGGLPNWPSLWPGVEITASLEGTGNWPSVSESRTLVDWFRAAVRADPASDAEWLAQCEAHYGADPMEEGVVLWLDAKTGGVGMDLAWLAHAEKACGSPQVMPISVVERLGGSRELIDALRQGHAEQAFRETSAQ